MALQKQPIELVFGGGIDTKVDPKTLPSGNLLILENAVLKKRNRIDKRNGYTKLGEAQIDGASVPSGDSLANFKDELLLYANQKLFSYSESTDSWIDKGSCVSAIVTTDTVVKNTYEQTQVDSDIFNGVAVFAYQDSSGGVRAKVIDNDKKTTIIADTLIDASGSRVRVIAFENYIHVFYYKSGSIWVRRINAIVPTAFDAAVEVVTDINTSDSTYDVIEFPEGLRLALAYNVQGASETRVCFVDVDGVVYSGSLAPITIAEPSVNSLALVYGPTNTMYIAYHNGTNGVRCVIVNSGLTVLHAAFTLNAGTTPVVNLTGIVKPDATGVKFFYEITAAAPNLRVTRSVTALTSGTASGDAVFLRGTGLSSKAFSYDSQIFVGIVHDSTLQATYFVARDDGMVIAKQKYGLAGGITARNILPKVCSLTAASFTYAFTTKEQLISENAKILTVKGVSQTVIDFTSSEIFTSAQLGNNLLICGGTLQNYDGQSVTEHGFHLFPENISATVSSSGGSINAGTYNYYVIYEWTDAQGQLHRSAPSVPLTLVIGGSNHQVTLQIPTLRLTQKKGTRAPVSIAVYRTTADGIIAYRVSSITSPLLNNTAVDSVTYVDSASDASITSREILYTVGNVLDNFSPGSCSTIAVFKNRIFLGGLENKNEVIYSKLITQGYPCEFAAEFSLLVDEKGSRVGALGVLDEKVVIFKDDRFYVTYGDGPDNTGFGGVFAQPEFVSADVGCINPQSLASLPGALTFKSAKGIYILDSSLSVNYFGAPVENYNSEKITSAVLKPDSNQIRFTTLAGACLVYDYFFQQWSVFTNHEANDATIWNDKYVYLRETGDVLIETAGVYKDDGAPYHLKVGTAWLSMAGINGFQRAYRFALLGEYKTDHILQIKAGFDFSGSLQTVMNFDSKTALDIKTFGEDSPFGSGSPYGGDNISYRVRGHLPRQKCQSIRFVIEELSTSASAGSGEALTLSGMTLLVGVKSAITKLKSAQSLG